MLTAIGVYSAVFLRVAVRLVHLVSSMIMLTVLVLECFCYLDRHPI